MSTKSKEIIVTTFLEILKDYNYNDITISEVLANTPLTRKTFYNNFSSKDDIIRYICNKLITQYITRLTNKTELSPYDFSRNFYEIGKEDKELFSLLFERELFYIFVEEFNKNMNLINSIIPQNKLHLLSEEDKNYVFAFCASGALRLFEIWVKSNFEKSIDEMALICTFIARDTRD